MQYEFENLQVGDKVIVRASYMGDCRHYVGEVVKRTPTGLLDVNYNGTVKRFKPDGQTYNRRDMWSILYSLCEYDEGKAKEIEEYNERLKNINFLRNVDWDKFTNDGLKYIVSEIKDLN